MPQNNDFDGLDIVIERFGATNLTEIPEGLFSGCQSLRVFPDPGDYNPPTVPPDPGDYKPPTHWVKLPMWGGTKK